MEQSRLFDDDEETQRPSDDPAFPERVYRIVRQIPPGKVTTYGTIAAVVFGLIYVFNPLDLVPDVLPFLGAVDDATVIGALLMLVERDLKKYRTWKEGQLTSEDTQR